MNNPYRDRIEQLMREGMSRPEAMEKAADYPEHQTNEGYLAGVAAITEAPVEAGLRPEARIRKRERLRDQYLEERGSESGNDLHKANVKFVKIRTASLKKSVSKSDVKKKEEEKLLTAETRAKIMNQDPELAREQVQESLDQNRKLVESSKKLAKKGTTSKKNATTKKVSTRKK